MEGRQFAWDNISASRLVCKTACELHFAILTAGSSNSYATFYDGENTNGRKIAKVEVNEYPSEKVHFGKGIYCESGLYVELESGMDEVLVQYLPLPKHRERG